MILLLIINSYYLTNFLSSHNYNITLIAGNTKGKKYALGLKHSEELMSEKYKSFTHKNKLAHKGNTNSSLKINLYDHNNNLL